MSKISHVTLPHNVLLIFCSSNQHLTTTLTTLRMTEIPFSNI